MVNPPNKDSRQPKKQPSMSSAEKRKDELNDVLLSSLKSIVSVLVFGFVLFLITYLYLIVKNNTVPSVESITQLFNSLASLVSAILGNGDSH
jgi:hypothetical protein